MKHYRTVTKTVLLGTLIIGLCWACTRPVNPDFPPHQRRLVLHGFTSLGDTIRVALDQTISYEETTPAAPRYVREATVLLYEDGLLRDTLKYNLQQEKYVSATVVALEGRTYKVEVAAPGFDKVEASATAPPPVAVSVLARTPSRRTLYGGTPLEDVRFSLTDPASQNFYMAVLGNSNSGFCVYTIDQVFEKFSSDIVPFDQNSCINNDEILFSDRSFNGTTRELTVSTQPHNLDNYYDANGNLVRSYLKVFHVNEDFYRYISEGLYTGFDADAPSLFEPVRVRGNVKGGYGLFTVFAATTDTIP